MIVHANQEMCAEKIGAELGMALKSLSRDDAEKRSGAEDGDVCEWMSEWVSGTLYYSGGPPSPLEVSASLSDAGQNLAHREVK